MAKFLSHCLHYDKSNKFDTGVYLIYHEKYPNRCYVGSASKRGKFKGFYSRFSSHYRALKHNEHFNKKLQNVVNKHGLEGIKFVPIESYPPELCIGMEQYYINLFEPYYNVCKIAGNTLGYKHTKNYLYSVRKQIVQYDLQGNFIAEHFGMAETCRKLNLDMSSISACCRNNTGFSQGYMWKFLENVTDEYGCIIKKIKPYVNSNNKKLLCYDLNGKFKKIYNSLSEVINDVGGNHGTLSHHLNGTTKRYKNYIFKYYKKNYSLQIKPYVEFHANQMKVFITEISTNKTEEYSSFREAVKSKKISRSTLMLNNKKNIKEFHHPKKSKKYKVVIEDYN